jgi:hypothetical protein
MCQNFRARLKRLQRITLLDFRTSWKRNCWVLGEWKWPQPPLSRILANPFSAFTCVPFADGHTAFLSFITWYVSSELPTYTETRSPLLCAIDWCWKSLAHVHFKVWIEIFRLCHVCAGGSIVVVSPNPCAARMSRLMDPDTHSLTLDAQASAPCCNISLQHSPHSEGWGSTIHQPTGADFDHIASSGHLQPSSLRRTIRLSAQPKRSQEGRPQALSRGPQLPRPWRAGRLANLICPP